MNTVNEQAGVAMAAGSTSPVSGAIYLDFQASTPVDPAVVSLMFEWLSNRCGNPHSGEHTFGWAARESVERARGQVARVVHADPSDIVFTSGATEANNLALFGVAQRAHPGRDTILVSSSEHASILAPARALGERGFRIVVLPIEGDGGLDINALETELSNRVLLVSVAAANNEIGTIQDLRAIGSRCHDVGALFHTDAVQALTGCDLPLGELPVDLASLSSHKAYGPAGIGALYVAPGRSRMVAPQLLGGDQQEGLRSGSLSTPLCIGFGHACALLAKHGAEERVRVAELRNELWGLLRAAFPGIQLNGGELSTRRHPGNLNVALPGIDAKELVLMLQPWVACSTGSACHSGIEGPSHVLLAAGLSHEAASASWRMSLGRQSTREDVQIAASRITQALNDLLLKDDAPVSSMT